MPENKHTPGPYRVEQNNGGNYLVIAGPESDIRVVAVIQHGLLTDSERQANARLIAAAPKQHGALLAVFSVLTVLLHLAQATGTKYDIGLLQHIIPVVQAAIAEVEGTDV